MVTRQQIRQRARIRADQTNSTFPTDAEYDLLIDECAKETWYDLIGAGWPTDQEDVNITANGATSYSLITAGAVATVDTNECWVPQTAFTPPTSVVMPTVGFVLEGAYGNDYTFNFADDGVAGSETFTVDHSAETIVYHYSPGDTTIGTFEADCEADGLLTVISGSPTPAADIPDEDPAGDATTTAFVAQSFAGGEDPGDGVFAITGVWRIDGGTFVPLRRINEGFRSSLQSTTGIAETYEGRVNSVDGAVVLFQPNPSSGSYRVRVLREYPGLQSEHGRWTGPPRSDELIVLRAAAKGRRKEGDDQGANQLDREHAALFDRVVNMASWFHMRDPAMIRDERQDTVLGAGWRDPFDYNVGNG